MQKTKLIPELKVLNFKRNLAFYVQLANFEILYDRPEEQFAMLNREGAQIMIEASTLTSLNWDVGILEYPFGRGMHLQIEVSNVHALHENFQNNNYPIFFPIQEKWYRKNQKKVGHRQFLVQDPDGYLLRFFEDLGENPL